MVGSHGIRRLTLAGLALAAVAGLGGCGGGSQSDAPATTEQATTRASTQASAQPSTQASAPAKTTAVEWQTIDIVVSNGLPKGGIERATVKKGATVTLVVHSDVADEIHLHGYNLMKDVTAGGVARITFVASAAGRFEAELEQRGVQIAELTVEQ